MSLVRFSLLALALGTTACVKQGQVHDTRPAPSIYELCDDVRFQSMCTPAPAPSAPIQIDTNLSAPPPADAPRLG